MLIRERCGPDSRNESPGTRPQR